jgi:hypothetical protein
MFSSSLRHGMTTETTISSSVLGPSAGGWEVDCSVLTAEGRRGMRRWFKRRAPAKVASLPAH